MIIDRLFDRSARGLLLVLPVLALLLLTSFPAFAQFPSGAMSGSASLKQAVGQQTVQPEDPTRQISGLLATLEDPASREKLTAQLRMLLQTQEQAKPAAVEPPSSRVLEFMSERVGRLSRQMIAFASIFADLPDTVEWLQGQATDQMRRERWLQVIFQLVLAVGAGFVVSALMSRLLRRARLSIESRRNDRILPRIPLVILRTIL